MVSRDASLVLTAHGEVIGSHRAGADEVGRKT